MKFRVKVQILALSVLLTFVGFNLIASPDYVDLIKAGKCAEYDAISNWMAKSNKESPECPVLERILEKTNFSN